MGLDDTINPVSRSTAVNLAFLNNEFDRISDLAQRGGEGLYVHTPKAAAAYYNRLEGCVSQLPMRAHAGMDAENIPLALSLRLRLRDNS